MDCEGESSNVSSNLVDGRAMITVSCARKTDLPTFEPCFPFCNTDSHSSTEGIEVDLPAGGVIEEVGLQRHGVHDNLPTDGDGAYLQTDGQKVDISTQVVIEDPTTHDVEGEVPAEVDEVYLVAQDDDVNQPMDVVEADLPNYSPCFPFCTDDKTDGYSFNVNLPSFPACFPFCKN